MAEFNIEKNGMNNFILDTQPKSVLTGGDDKSRYLLYALKLSIGRAERIDMIIAFLMASGVRLILEDLKRAADRGVKIRILTGKYLNITQPEALYLLKEALGERISLKFYKESGRSFHPKAYMFGRGDYTEIYVGSSNISKSAFTSGIEWNYRFDNEKDKESCRKFQEEFERLYEKEAEVIDDEALKLYAKNWRRPSVYKDIEKIQKDAKETQGDTFLPRGVQIEALYHLKEGRREGEKRGLVCAATGIGKTYLAAFDSKNFKRVLFIAHREEILNQAAKSFQKIRPSDSYGFFDGKEKSTDKSLIFASVDSLGKQEYLTEEYFTKNYFEYIVVDEFHHAAADKYKKILDYFEPRYLLGLTATPERLDGKDIFKLCDYNVPYEVHLQEAINRGILVPFHYYGIYDATVDYSKISIDKGHYNEKELTRKYIQEGRRAELIYKHYRKYRSKKALGFCCSRGHAEKMAEEFCKRGVPSVAVYSNSKGGYSEDREIAIEKLKSGEIKVIFSVDMFNEGVDICEVDMVMFLRPTESPVIFLQQLGRGLRRCEGKEYLNVLDFIGNYEKAGIAPFLLSGESYSSIKGREIEKEKFTYPVDCVVDFQIELLDLFQHMSERHMKKAEKIRREYYRIKEFLEGRIPSRMELFTYMDDEIMNLCKREKKNPFRGYLAYLNELGELREQEQKIYRSIGNDFLESLERTHMSKSYKIPVLKAFYNHGQVKTSINEEDIYESYISFYNTGNNRRDLERDKSTRGYKTWNKERFVKEALKNPVHFLLRSGEGFFIEREGTVLALREDLEEIIKMPGFAEQMKDILEFRTVEYYRSRYEAECERLEKKNFYRD